MSKPTRWVTETKPGHSQWYIDRFRRLAAEGRTWPARRGCWTRWCRRAPASWTRAAAPDGWVPRWPPGATAWSGSTPIQPWWRLPEPTTPGPIGWSATWPRWSLAAQGEAEPFDAAVIAGNVMAFVAPGTERAVLTRVAAHVRPDGLVVVGFGTDRGYPLTDFDADAVAAGLRLEHRFATWDLRPWRAEADFAVSVLRRPAG